MRGTPWPQPEDVEGVSARAGMMAVSTPGNSCLDPIHPSVDSQPVRDEGKGQVLKGHFPLIGQEEEMLPGEAPGLVALSLQGDGTRSKDLRNSHTSLKRNCCKPKSASCRIMETA